METILWFAGVLAMWTGIKFVFMVFKRLGSKNTMNNLIDRMEDGMAEAADNVAGYYEKRKRRKRDEERPIVTIR
jgi:hypothetical protein